MKKIALTLLMLIGITLNAVAGKGPIHIAGNLKIVIIRHGEKPLKGDNLSCRGLNRAMQLPKVITDKFGVPAMIFVPSMAQGNGTLHARMFQTIVPLAGKYNLKINTAHAIQEYDQTATDLQLQSGTVLVCWEHKAIPFIAKALGIETGNLTWPDDDYDSIWVITFPKGVPTLTKEKEGIQPSDKCDF